MDTSTQVTEVVTGKGQSGTIPKPQHRTVEEKRRIVEATLVAGASVARVARAHGVNANQVFGWRNNASPRSCFRGFVATESADSSAWPYDNKSFSFSRLLARLLTV